MTDEDVDVSAGAGRDAQMRVFSLDPRSRDRAAVRAALESYAARRQALMTGPVRLCDWCALHPAGPAECSEAVCGDCNYPSCAYPD